MKDGIGSFNRDTKRVVRHRPDRPSGRCCRHWQLSSWVLVAVPTCLRTAVTQKARLGLASETSRGWRSTLTCGTQANVRPTRSARATPTSTKPACRAARGRRQKMDAAACFIDVLWQSRETAEAKYSYMIYRCPPPSRRRGHSVWRQANRCVCVTPFPTSVRTLIRT